MRVTVEGVETAKQAAFLEKADGDQAQGFYFGRPVPASEVAANILADFQQQHAARVRGRGQSAAGQVARAAAPRQAALEPLFANPRPTRYLRRGRDGDRDGCGRSTGIKVLDVTRVLAGPWCTMTLADLGAEVWKIENPAGGDDTRSWTPPSVEGISTYFLAANRNKKSVAVDLKTPQGRAVVAALAAKADVLVANLRPASLQSAGLGYERLSAINPAARSLLDLGLWRRRSVRRAAGLRFRDAGRDRLHVDHRRDRGRAHAARRRLRGSRRRRQCHAGDPGGALCARAHRPGTVDRYRAVRQRAAFPRQYRVRISQHRGRSRPASAMPMRASFPTSCSTPPTAASRSRSATTSSTAGCAATCSAARSCGTDERFRTNAGRTRNREVLIPRLQAEIGRTATAPLLSAAAAARHPGRRGAQRGGGVRVARGAGARRRGHGRASAPRARCAWCARRCGCPARPRSRRSRRRSSASTPARCSRACSPIRRTQIAELERQGAVMCADAPLRRMRS